MPPDSYFKKEVSLHYEGQDIRFRVAQDLFSSFEVDSGSRLLLRSLADADISKVRKVLDLGCGYGVIGLALKAAYRSGSVQMVDRDALAVEYSRQNAALNGLDDIEAYGSLGYDDVAERDFDLIASNIPGQGRRAGDYAPSPRSRALPQARCMVAVVVVAALPSTVAAVLVLAP